LKDWIKNLMPDTIQFCGDSCCADTDDNAWTTILAKKLGAIIIGKGKGGTAHEYVFKTFNPNATYTVISWTEASRVHVPDRDLDISPAVQAYSTPNDIFPVTDKLWPAAMVYYKYIHNTSYAELRQQRELYWFDQAVLSQSKTKIIHIFIFKNLYTFTHGYTFEIPYTTRFEIYDEASNDLYSNHLNHKDNKLLADELYSKFTDPLLFS